MGKRGPKPKPKLYFSTVDDMLVHQEKMEQQRRSGIKAGMKRYRQMERDVQSACMSTEQMRMLDELFTLMMVEFKGDKAS